jgi:hypothetical protein
VVKINPLLEEIELDEKVNSLLSFGELHYVLRDSKLKQEKLKKVETTRSEVECSSIDYEKKSRMLQKIYGVKFVLGLKETNYLQLLASGGIGFAGGFLANDNFRNYLNKIAREFVDDFQKYSKS